MNLRLGLSAAVVFIAALLIVGGGVGSRGEAGETQPGPAVSQFTVYTAANAPVKPAKEDLPLVEQVSQHGITWTFKAKVRAGRFITGDWYVVGPVTVQSISPRPLFGKEVENGTPWTALDTKDAAGKTVRTFVEVDETERIEFGGFSPRVKGEEKEKLLANPHYCRNGSVLNVPPELAKSGFDSRVRHGIYAVELTARLPISMKPGDALVSTISRKEMPRDKHYTTTAAVAILTCLAEPVPADSFRPGYTDPEKKVYRASDLKRELLPRLPKPAMADARRFPEMAKLAAIFERPWLEYNLFHEDHAPYQMGGYGQGLARRGGDTAGMLCLDFTAEEKEPLLIGYVQFGIDLYGMLKAGYGGWQAYGGWNSGHKHPIILAGVLLSDDKMAYVSKTFPKASFQEDEQTGYGRTWRGAPVVFLGHSGVDAATGKGRTRGRKDWGPYEHKHPSKWHDRNWQSESYRRCCTSRAWIGTAIAARLMKLEKYWGHDAFFDYVDRWMTEDEAEALKIMAEVDGGRKFDSWAHQGQVEIPFHEAMWKTYRPKVEPDVNNWRKREPVDAWGKADAEEPDTPPATPASDVGHNQQK